ncbi:flagellar hook assembly protein FlgD [Pleionea sp. CnH1-48]|uniref:flagellar hook assembly protein FlgD n=1 Tax=Pleionea sp. CnH1-48 TaxID=2954494 RepID=UPI002096A74D|nr:flagellar hook assembly protein FlgD [Pleionea sp. CnH1-48]MCO7226159.1 flagellar hook assembly protein FlgD [Pleionea sp. CnH1-48]
MNSVNNTNPYNDLGLNRESELQTGNKDQLGQADFLALLTTQLANQDPFQPVDNQQFIAQMAEFSSLSSMQELNKSFESFASSMTSNHALQASSLVGREVIIPTSQGYLSEEGGISGRVSLTQSAQDMWVEVKDAQGLVVKRFELGSYSAGDLDFDWDGLNEHGERAAEGVYNISVFGRVGNQTEQLGTSMRAQVGSVNIGGADQRILLNLNGLGQVYLDDVQEIG